MNIDLSNGIRLYKNKSYAKALKEFENFINEVLEDSQEKVELDYHIGLTLTKLEKYDEALLHLEQVVNSHNSVLHIFQSRMILGYIYSITKRYRLAEFEFNKLIEEGAQSPQCPRLRGGGPGGRGSVRDVESDSQAGADRAEKGNWRLIPNSRFQIPKFPAAVWRFF